MDRLRAWYTLKNEAGGDIPPFAWEEWSVFSVVLAFSVGIGIFFGCFGKKNQTNEEYLLGGRTMHPVPVALSLLCSYVSSITLLGTPVEIYYYGSQLSMVLLAYIPLTLSLAFIYVPIYFQLQYTSIFEVRFLKKSRYSESKLDFALMSDGYDDESFELMLRNDSDELFQKGTSKNNSTLESNYYQDDIDCSTSPISEMHDRGDGLFRKPCCNCVCDMHTQGESPVDKSNPERNWNVSTTELLIQVEQETSLMAGENSVLEKDSMICAPNDQEDLFGLFAGDDNPIPPDQCST